MNATTSYLSLSRKKVLKLWKSRPAAPMIMTLHLRIADAPSKIGCVSICGLCETCWHLAKGSASGELENYLYI